MKFLFFAKPWHVWIGFIAGGIDVIRIFYPAPPLFDGFPFYGPEYHFIMAALNIGLAIICYFSLPKKEVKNAFTKENPWGERKDS